MTYCFFRITITVTTMIAPNRAYWSGAGWVVCRAGAVVVVVAVVARDVGFFVSATRIVVGTFVRATFVDPMAYRFLSLLPT